MIWLNSVTLAAFVDSPNFPASVKVESLTTA
jgi:hypothetical protein